jgi:hypothetical protein
MFVCSLLRNAKERTMHSCTFTAAIFTIFNIIIHSIVETNIHLKMLLLDWFGRNVRKIVMERPQDVLKSIIVLVSIGAKSIGK